MTTNEKIETVRILANEQKMDDEAIAVYLNIAGMKIKERAFPFDHDEEMPSRYDLLQCEIATYLINKIGAEGQTAHTEGEVSRSYESASVPNSMLKSVTPFSKAIGEEE